LIARISNMSFSSRISQQSLTTWYRILLTVVADEMITKKKQKK